MKIKAMGNRAAATISLISLILLNEWLIYINSVYQKGWGTGDWGTRGQGDKGTRGTRGHMPSTSLLFPLFEENFKLYVFR
jgi:hypothetical protein